MSKIKQFASNFKHNNKYYKSGESASNRPGQGVRDSILTIEGQTSAGAFTGLISLPSGSCRRLLPREDVTGDPLRRHHPLVLTLALAILAIPFCFTAPTHATTSTISLAISGSPTVNIASSADGKFADSGNSTITITTNHAAGYTLTAKASSSTSLVGANTGNNLVTLDNGTAISAETFNTSTYNDKWGYKPSKYNSVDNTTTQYYYPSPGLDTAQSPLDTLDITNSASGSPYTYTVSIGARVTTATTIDNYANGFVFAVVGNPTQYTITYNANAGSDTVTNMPSPNPDTSSANGETVTNAISATVPERDGYNFKGWCSTTTSDETCSGTTYNPDGDGSNRNITLNQQSSTNTFTLYAMWESAATPTVLWDAVKADWEASGSRVQTNDTDTNTGIQAAITTANSGVFKYNSSVFGADSDATKSDGTKADIYYYRGILDTTVGSYGSNGDNAAHPNTVLLDANKNGADTSDTCWRIVRTTASGGVKMIYQGRWTSADKCKNATTDAQVTMEDYNLAGSGSGKSIVKVGYTFNNSYATRTTATGAGTLFGSNYGYSGNSTSSTIKTYIENTWFTDISSYTSVLEPSAGYCNDRSVGSGTSWTSYWDGTSITTPYTTNTSGITQFYFGARMRNYTTYQILSLTCPRNVVDLYTTSSASDGNKQLSQPAALLTADEVSFAGSGQSTAANGSTYHANSYLRSGSGFWLLSPSYRDASGNARVFFLQNDGILNYDGSVIGRSGVRPAISLTSGTTAASGSGTAADPWVVPAP